jgi:hypothetical protein
VGGAGFVQNLLLWSDVGYFDNASETKPLLHLWSLAVEEQFYIFWPLLLALVVRWRIRVTWFVAAVAAVSFAMNIALVRRSPSAAFYFPVPRFWELMAGALLAELAQGSGQRLARWPRVTSIAGLALIVLSCAVLDQKHAFPGFWAILPVAGATLVIAAGSSSPINQALLTNRPMVWIGKISYPLYLWHWPLFSLLNICVVEVPLGLRLAAAGLAVLLAWGTYEIVERPFRSKSTSRWLVVAPIAVLLVAGAAGTSVWALGGLPTRAVNKTGASVFDFLRHWDGWRECGLLENTAGGGCRILHAERPIDVMVIGDSHAGHLGTGLHDQFKDSPMNVAVLLNAGCFPVFSTTDGQANGFSCPDNNIDRALRTAIDSKDAKTVVLTGYANVHIFESRFPDAPTIGPEKILANAAALEKALDETLTQLERAGKRIVFLIDVPELEKEPRVCIDRQLPLLASRCDLDIQRARVDERNRHLLDLSRRLSVRHAQVRFVSAIDVLCDPSVCHGSQATDLLYASRDHLTPAGSRVLVGALANVIRETVAQH